jgi:hypothetical protein
MSFTIHGNCVVLLAGESLFGVQAKGISNLGVPEQNKLREDIDGVCHPYSSSLITVGLKYNKTNLDAAKFGRKIMKIDPNSATWKKAIGFPE